MSVVGDTMYVVATMWLVYELTGSSFYTGLAGFLMHLPGMFQVLVGPVVDRVRLQQALILPEVAQGAIVLVLPVAAAIGRLDLIVVLVTVILLGFANLFSEPAHHATLPTVVDDDRLVRANSVFSTISHGATAATRTAGGALIALIGATALYVIDAVTFVFAALAFVGVTADRDRKTDHRDFDVRDVIRSYRQDLMQGTYYVTRTPVGLPWIGSLVANFLVAATLAVLPAYAASMGDATTYGLLYAAIGVGSFTGALLAPLFEDSSLGITTVTGFLIGGAVWLGGVFVGAVEVVAIAFWLAFVPVGVYNVLMRTVVQIGVPDDALGRVRATTGSARSLVYPAGYLVGGVAGSALGNSTVVAVGVGFFIVSCYWVAHPLLRRFEAPTSVPADAYEPESGG